MRYLFLSITIFCMLILNSCGGQDKGFVSLGEGRLVRWSGQIVDSSKKIIFIHGYCRDIQDPYGLTLPEMESDFSPKLENLDILGTESFGHKTTEVVEYWFYGYNPRQDIGKIAADLMELIRKNRNFNDAQIALVGYSQGGVIAWLIDQRSNLICGGVILGAPILSTPLVHKGIRDAAIKSVYPVANQSIITAFDQLSGSIEHLQITYLESEQAKSDLLFMVGRINIPSDDAWTRNVDLVDALLAECDDWLSNTSNSRQLFEVGSTLIDASDWDNCNEDECFSDGVVPVNSACVGGNGNFQIWKDYDHIDLMSGKGDFNIDRATLQHLGKVLDLFPKFVEADLPLLPELEIHFSNKGSVWDWIKFAYVINGSLFITDADWDRKELVYSGKNCYPRFGSNHCLTWTNLTNNNFNLCIWREEDVIQRNSDSSKYASFSISDKELVYQLGGDLIIHNLASDKSHVLVHDVNLIAPPVLVQNKSSYKIYFANQEVDKTINLYSISSKVSNKYLANAQIVATNCSVPFLATGLFNGVVVVSNIGKSHQLIKVVSGGKLVSNISIDITRSDMYEISGTTKGIKLKLAEEFKFNSMVFDAEYGHLYLVGSVGSVDGLWLLDINRIIVSNNASWDEIFYLVLPKVEYIDIKLAD